MPGLGDTIYTATRKALEEVFGSGGGEGSAATTDVYIWNMSDDDVHAVLPTSVLYISGFSNGFDPVVAELAFTAISETVEQDGEVRTFYGVKASDAPVGAALGLVFPESQQYSHLVFGYADSYGVFSTASYSSIGSSVLMPISGCYCVGEFALGNPK